MNMAALNECTSIFKHFYIKHFYGFWAKNSKCNYQKIKNPQHSRHRSGRIGHRLNNFFQTKLKKKIGSIVMICSGVACGCGNIKSSPTMCIFPGYDSKSLKIITSSHDIWRHILSRARKLYLTTKNKIFLARTCWYSRTFEPYLRWWWYGIFPSTRLRWARSSPRCHRRWKNHWHPSWRITYSQSQIDWY